MKKGKRKSDFVKQSTHGKMQQGSGHKEPQPDIQKTFLEQKTWHTSACAMNKTDLMMTIICDEH